MEPRATSWQGTACTPCVEGGSGRGDGVAEAPGALAGAEEPFQLINVESGNYGAVNYGLLLSGAVIAMIPCIVVYVSLQRFSVCGLVSGALKGRGPSPHGS